MFPIQNNRHRQAPSTQYEKNKQSAPYTDADRAYSSLCTISSPYRRTKQNWRFCCFGNPKIHVSICPATALRLPVTNITIIFRK